MRRLLVAATLLVLSAACTQGFPDAPIGGGGSIGSGGGGGLTASYTLTTINGQPLPYTYFTSGSDKYDLLDDVLAVNANGTWTERYNERHTVSGVVTTPSYLDGGTYVATGSKLAFTSTTPGFDPYFEGTLSGTTLVTTMAFTNGTTAPAIYTKQ
jgi:hypothetical protein